MRFLKDKGALIPVKDAPLPTKADAVHVPEALIAPVTSNPAVTVSAFLTPP